jgi:hypothetical protein
MMEMIAYDFWAQHDNNVMEMTDMMEMMEMKWREKFSYIEHPLAFTKVRSSYNPKKSP